MERLSRQLTGLLLVNRFSRAINPTIGLVKVSTSGNMLFSKLGLGRSSTTILNLPLSVQSFDLAGASTCSIRETSRFFGDFMTRWSQTWWQHIARHRKTYGVEESSIVQSSTISTLSLTPSVGVWILHEPFLFQQHQHNESIKGAGSVKPHTSKSASATPNASSPSGTSAPMDGTASPFQFILDRVLTRTPAQTRRALIAAGILTSRGELTAHYKQTKKKRKASSPKMAKA